MKKIILLIVLTLALLASVFAAQTAYAETLQPWNVIADIVCGKTVFHYDLSKEISAAANNCADRGFYLGATGKKQLAESLLSQKLPPQAVYEYLLPNFKNILRKFQFVNVQKRDATVRFDVDGFHYTNGTDGVTLDAQSLFFAMLKSGGNKITVQLPVIVHKAITVSQLKQNTVFKASFTTYYPQSSANRCHNIARATAALNGTTVMPQEKFSFNQIVGPRTEADGYLPSKIILDGMYTDGIGGGVCQVSSTLYNALLLAEILPAACQHTLVSSYVAAGFDAMVSYGGADLTFVNNTDFPLYIFGKADDKSKSVTFTVYGTPNRYRVERESVEERDAFRTLEVVDGEKYPELVYSDQTKVVTSGSDGVKSQSYLLYYDGNRLVERKLIRQNTYKRVDRVIARGAFQR